MRHVILVLAVSAAGCAGVPGWRPQSSGSTASLRGVCAVGESVAWASGAGGTCLRTTDGGRTWQRLAIAGGANLDFRDVHATSADHAVVLSAGLPARIYATKDGGASWSLRYESNRTGVFFDAFAFFSDGRGLAFSDPVDGSFLVLRTQDGAVWSAIDPAALPAPIEGEAGFAGGGCCLAVLDPSHAWIGTGGKAARVLATHDGGASWQTSATPVVHGAASTGIFGVAFADHRRGVVVGGDYEHPDRALAVAAWTDDGGTTWRRCASGPRGYRSGLACKPTPGSAVFVAVGTTGSDISVDGGQTWRAIGDTGYHAVSFSPDGKAGWAVGAGGRIARFEVK